MLFDQIQQDLKTAMLAKDELRVSTLRLLLSEIKNAQIQKGGELEERDIVSVIQKEAKKRKEAASGFRQGNREEQAKREESELNILEGYLPQQLQDEELTKIIEDTIKETGAKSLQDIGRVMGMVMGKVGQSADGGRVSQEVRNKLV